MAELSRRSFITVSTGTLLLGGRSCLARSAEGNRGEALRSAVRDQSGDGLDRPMYLIGRPLPDGGMVPSARVFRPSELPAKVVRGADGKQYLETGERVIVLRPDLPVRVEVRKVGRMGSTADAAPGGS